MRSLPDRASIIGALTIELAPRLRALLQSRITKLDAPDGDLADMTHILVVEPGDTEAAIVEAVGFSPLVSPIDGARYGTAGFEPWSDWLQRHDGWFELVVCVGDSGFAYVLLIADDPGTNPELLALCREHARETDHLI